MIKVAVIGAGTMGSVHSDAYTNMKNADLVGIVDIRRNVAEELAQKCGTRAYSSLEELLAHEDPAVIDVCVPTYLHKSYVKRIASAKKHVICEKPIARHLEDAKEMIDHCEQEGVRLFIAQVLRFFPDYKKAYDLVLEEAVGTVGTVRTMRGGVFPTAWEDWYANTDKSGTLIVDMMIHDFDFLRWCFGDVERVYAKSLLGREQNRMDHALVSLRFKNGIIAHAEGTWAYPDGFKTELEIAGDQGILVHDSDLATAIRTSIRTSSTSGSGVAVPESPLNNNPYYLELEHFLDCIVTGKEPIIQAKDAYKALEISIAALQSVQTGQPVHL